MKSFQAPRNVKIAERHQDRCSSGSTIEPEDAHLAGAVDARRFEQFVRESSSAYWRTRKMPNMPAIAGTITPA